MVDNVEESKYKYEYAHHILYPGIHFGKHAQFGTHVAIGDGANSIHIYPSKIYIGGKDGSSVSLSPSQMMIITRVLNRLEQKVKSDTLLEKIKLEEKDKCLSQTSALPKEPTTSPPQSAVPAQSGAESPPAEQSLQAGA